MTEGGEQPTSAGGQVRFLTDVQRLLSEGLFTASYKFALLMALADLAVERGDDSGAALHLPLRDISEKFVQYYWRQAAPYVGPAGESSVLSQNTGKQAAIVSRITQARMFANGKLTAAQEDRRAWHSLIRDVRSTVEREPLWKLQVVGGGVAPFLYEHEPVGDGIELRPGVAAHFRKFYDLLRNLIEGAWIRHVRSLKGNQCLLGQASDLGEFLFGSERADLSAFRLVLEAVQSGNCFYCQKPFRGATDVDHFIPWSRYPIDLGHNFVLAHASCNRAKGDRLAGVMHLQRWVERNDSYAQVLEAEFSRLRVSRSLEKSCRVTQWAYAQAEAAGANAWLLKSDVVPLGREWRRVPLPQFSAGSV